MLPSVPKRPQAVPLVCLLLVQSCGHASGFPASERVRLREKVREMFYHAYAGYMAHAFPHDELRPLSRTYTNSLIELGNAVRPTREGYKGVALTLIDSLDTLAVLGNASEFAWAVRWVEAHVSFDQDVDVSLFETNIRVLGGLLSAHLLAAGEVAGAEHVTVAGYEGGLLRLATDLGERFLTAFDPGAPRGICTQLPRAFVRLRGGLPRAAHQEQCTAGAGTLLLEMGMLSRLTADPRFESAALCALRVLWNKRSPLDLMGNSIDGRTGAWRNAAAGIGAGADSFYEYLLKGYLVFGHAHLFEMWNASYVAVNTHLRRGGWYGEAHMNKGGVEAAAHVDSLAAFWPALQVLAGDVADASALHSGYHALWRRFGSLPERFDLRRGRVAEGPWADTYPLRPELAESCYALHRATRVEAGIPHAAQAWLRGGGGGGESPHGGMEEPSPGGIAGRGGTAGGGEVPPGGIAGGDSRYMEMGAEMVASIDSRMRVPAGFAALSSVQKGTHEDHMPSFFLAETLKYLFLLFDEDNFVNTHGGSLLFTTEGHLVPLSLRFSSPRSLQPRPPAAAPTYPTRTRSGVSHWAVSSLWGGEATPTATAATTTPSAAISVPALVASSLPAAEAVRGATARQLRAVASAAPGVSHADCFEMSCLRERAAEALTMLRRIANEAMTCPVPFPDFGQTTVV